MMLALTVSFALGLHQAPQTRGVSEQDARVAAGMVEQVYERWQVACDTPGVRDLRIAFDVALDADGAIVGEPRPVRPQDTLVYRAAADGARRALIEASPFATPEGYAGGDYRPVFDFARACARADED